MHMEGPYAKGSVGLRNGEPCLCAALNVGAGPDVSYPSDCPLGDCSRKSGSEESTNEIRIFSS